MRCLFLGISALLVAWCTTVLAGAEPAPLSEREAEELAERELRAHRWDEAIAAFAQTRKHYPAPTFETHDPRSDVVQRVLGRILEDLERRGAPAAEREPFWSFTFDHFPFFSTGSWNLRFDARWDPDFIALARFRLGRADPLGKEPRFDLCRRLEAWPIDAPVGPLLDLLEHDWPVPHEDFGCCAFHAWRILDAGRRAIAEVSAQIDFGARAREAYLACFVHSPYLGAAVEKWNHGCDGLDPALAHPRVRRWIDLDRWQSWVERQSTDPDSAGGAPRISSPWIPSALVEAWVATHELLDPDYSRDLPETALAKAAEFVRTHAGSSEARAVRYFALVRSRLHDRLRHRRWRAQFVETWRREDPEDPFLLWAEVDGFEVERNREPEGRLPDAAIRRLEEIVAKHPAESIRLAAEAMLARDEIGRGRGGQALARYRRMLEFDPRGIRLSCPVPPEARIDDARDQLLLHHAVRDPAGLALILEADPPAGGDSPFHVSTVICGNAVADWDRDARRRTAWLWARAGRPREAAEAYLRAALFAGREAGGDPESALDYAEVACASGDLVRVSETADRVAREQPMIAATLRGLLDALAAVDQDGIAAALALLARAEDTKQVDELAVLRQVFRLRPALRSAAARAYEVPPTAESRALALAVGDEEAIAYLLEHREKPDPTGRPAGIRFHLLDRGALTLGIIDRMAIEGVQAWEELRGLLPEGRYDPWDRLGWVRGVVAARTHPDEAIRDWAAYHRERARRTDPWLPDPWLLFCVEGE